MAPENLSQSAKASKEEFDLISNRIAIALAKRDNLIKSWTASSSRPHPPVKTQEELDAEEAKLFRNEPPFLGVGAPIPSHFLVSEAERNNKSLRAKFFPAKGLKTSKPRDAEEKSAVAKRGLKEYSSDDEEGRSGLGRAKKLKLPARPSTPHKEVDPGIKHDWKQEEAKPDMLSNVRGLPQLHQISSGSCIQSQLPYSVGRPPASTQMNGANATHSKSMFKESHIYEIQTDVPHALDREVIPTAKSAKETKREELKRRKKQRKERRKQLKQAELNSES